MTFKIVFPFSLENEPGSHVDKILFTTKMTIFMSSQVSVVL